MTSARPHEVAFLVSAAMAASESHVAADVRLDGARYLFRLSINEAEGDRRSRYGLGAVVDTGVLHALWSVQSAEADSGELHPRDIATLGHCDPGLVSMNGGEVVGLYKPIGVVDLIASRRQGPDLAIARALAMPPIFQRVAMWRRGREHGTTEINHVMARARRDGIGLIQWEDDTATVVSHPRPAVRGVPGVYRWLVAELAYESWLHAQRAQA